MVASPPQAGQGQGLGYVEEPCPAWSWGLTCPRVRVGSAIAALAVLLTARCVSQREQVECLGSQVL